MAWRRLLAALAVVLAVIGASVLVVDYGIELMVVQPALLAGEVDGLSLWSPYDPHGVFIALENLGYAAFGAAFVLLGAALAGRSGAVLRAVRATFTAGGTLILVALVALAGVYRAGLDYRFEVAGLSLAWLVLVVTGTLLAVMFAAERPSPRALP